MYDFVFVKLSINRTFNAVVVIIVMILVTANNTIQHLENVFQISRFHSIPEVNNKFTTVYLYLFKL